MIMYIVLDLCKVCRCVCMYQNQNQKYFNNPRGKLFVYMCMSMCVCMHVCMSVYIWSFTANVLRCTYCNMIKYRMGGDAGSLQCCQATRDH